jgi:hypothetical protein
MSQTRDDRGIGRADFRLPETVIPEGQRCIKLYAPDDVEHLRVIAGLLHELALARNWRGGSELDRDQVASMYQTMLDDIPWSGDCDEDNCRTYPPDCPLH